MNIFLTTYFREWNRRPRGMETPFVQSPRKFRDISNTYNIRFIMVYRTIIDVILHLFIICYDLWCQLPFFKKTFRHNGSTVFGKMPQMCRGCRDVNKHRGMDTAIFRQHRPFMSMKSFVQHSGWQEMVSLCSLIHLIDVCADRDQPEPRVPLFSLGLKVPWSPCGDSGRLSESVIYPLSQTWGLETRYIDIEKSISIIDRNFHIDLYRLYR